MTRSNAVSGMVFNDEALRFIQSHRNKLINLPSVQIVRVVFNGRCVLRFPVGGQLTMNRSSSVFNGYVI